MRRRRGDRRRRDEARGHGSGLAELASAPPVPGVEPHLYPSSGSAGWRFVTLNPGGSIARSSVSVSATSTEVLGVSIANRAITLPG